MSHRPYILCLLLASACSAGQIGSSHTPPTKPAQHTSDGTQHVGGGDGLAIRSTALQVHHAIDTAVDLINRGASFTQDLQLEIYNDSATTIEQRRLITAVIYGPYGGPEQPFDRLFSTSKLFRKERGDCVASGKHVAASVSEFKHGADICISIERLTSFSPDSLLRQVISLFLHEAAHLRGYGEDEAVWIQTRSFAFFGDHFNPDRATRERKNVAEKLERVKGYFDQAISGHQEHRSTVSILVLLGKASELLDQVRLTKGGMLPFGLLPAYPALTTNVDLSLYRLLNDGMSKAIQLQKTTAAEGAASANESTQALRTALAMLKDLQINWRAFMFGDAQPICIAPDEPKRLTLPVTDVLQVCESLRHTWQQRPAPKKDRILEQSAFIWELE